MGSAARRITANATERKRNPCPTLSRLRNRRAPTTSLGRPRMLMYRTMPNPLRRTQPPRTRAPTPARAISSADTMAGPPTGLDPKRMAASLSRAIPSVHRRPVGGDLRHLRGRAVAHAVDEEGLEAAVVVD